MLVRGIADGSPLVREFAQDLARRAPDTGRVRVGTRKQFVDLVFRCEFRRFTCLAFVSHWLCLPIHHPSEVLPSALDASAALLVPRAESSPSRDATEYRRLRWSCQD